MGTLADLVVKISLQDELSKGLSDVQNKLNGVASNFRKIGAGLTAGVTLPVVAMGAKIVSAASDLNEAQSAVNTVFGDSANVINDYAKTSATAMGVSQSAYLDAASGLGALFTGMGLSDKTSADFSSNILQNASDLASFYNTDPGTALQDLNSGLVGEAEPLRKYGILLSEAAVQQKAMEQTGKANAKQLTESEKVTARYALIQEQMGAAQGDFARTSGGLANQQRILRAQLADTAAQMGQVLLPFVLQAVHALSGLLTWVQNLSPAMQKWAVIIGVVAAAMGPLLLILGAMLPALAALLSPIGLIVLALAAIAAVLTMAYLKNWGGFADGVNAVAKNAVQFVKTFKKMYDLISKTGKYGKVTSAFRALGFAIADITGLNPKLIVDFFTGLGKAVDRPIQALKKMAEALGGIGKAILSGDFKGALQQGRKFLAGFGDYIASPAKAIGQFLKGIQTGFAPLDNVLHTAGKLFTDFGRLVQEVFQGDLSGALDVAQRMFGHLGDLGQQAWDLIKAGFDAIDWAALWNGITDVTGTILSKLGDLSVALTKWVIDAVAGINWGGLWNGVTNVVSTIVAKLGDLVSGLKTWVTGAVSSVPWGSLWDGITDVTATIISKLGDLAAALLIWATNAASGIDWAGIFSAAAETLKTVGAALVQGVIDGWNSVLPTLGNLAGFLIDYVKGVVPGAATALFDVGVSFIQSVIDGWNSILATLGNLAGILISYVIDLVPDVGDGLKSKGAALIQTIIDGINAMTGPIQAAVDGIVSIIGGIKTAIETAISWIDKIPGVNLGGGSGGGGGDSGGVTGVVDPTKTITMPPPDTSLFLAAVQKLQADFNTTMQAVTSAATAWSTIIGEIIGTQFGDMVSNTNALMQGFRANFATAMNAILANASSGAQGVYSVVSAAFGQLVGNVSALLNVIPGIVAGAMNSAANVGGAAAYNAGLAIGGGLANGINAMIPAVQAAAQALANAAIVSTNNTVKVSSPSKVFHQIGVYVGEGFVNGIESRYAAASRAGNGLAASAIPGIGGSGSSATGRSTSGFTNYGTIRVEAPSPEDFYQQWRQQQMGGVRR